MRLASRVPKLLFFTNSNLNKLGNNKDNFTLGGDIAKCSFLFQKLSFDNSNQKVRQNRYQRNLVLSNFPVFVNFLPNILSGTVWANIFFFITMQIPNSLGEKFSQWDCQNETIITHYEKKNRDHAKCFLFWENHVSLRIYIIEL